MEEKKKGEEFTTEGAEGTETEGEGGVWWHLGGGIWNLRAVTGVNVELIGDGDNWGE